MASICESKDYDAIKRDITSTLGQRIMILDGSLEIKIPPMLEVKNLDRLLGPITCHHIYTKHTEYLMEGSDIIKTFNGITRTGTDFSFTDLAYRINCQTAFIARTAADEATKTTGIQKYVAGALGLTNRIRLTNTTKYRDYSFDELVIMYQEETRAFLDEFVDILMVETTFDSSSTKAALFAIETVLEERNKKVPIFISGTVAQSGRMHSGQTIEAFLISISHASPMCVGLNCAFGVTEMQSFVECMSRNTNAFVFCCADLPYLFGEYEKLSDHTDKMLKTLANDGKINIVGGCYGATPRFIRTIAKSVEGITPGVPPKSLHDDALNLSGLETLRIGRYTNFVNIGERCNAARSRKFCELIQQNEFDKALDVAKTQVENGAVMLDINMDEMLDGQACMEKFVNLIASKPDIGRVPLCISSERFKNIESGLKCSPGKCIVNGISLKAGEDDFIKKAKMIKKFGAAVVVMACDENGQATDADRKLKICLRSFEILVNEIGYNPMDVIFDPGILPIGTGAGEHNESGIQFMQATTRIKEQKPGCRIIGGVSNLSLAFRGKEKIREAMHSVFLYHAIKVGMDMGIVNPGRLPLYSNLNKELLELCEDILWNKSPEATEKLSDYAQVQDCAIQKKVEFKQVEKRILHVLSNNPRTLTQLEPNFEEMNLREYLANPRMIPHDIDNCRWIMLQLLHGLEDILNLGFVHCGLSDENIVIRLTNEALTVKFSNLETYIKKIGETVDLRRIERAFVPIEHREAEYCVVDASFQVFSLGIIFLNIITGGNIRDNLENVDEGYKYVNVGHYRDFGLAVDTIKKMISRFPEDRPRLEELKSDPIIWTDGQLIHYIRISYETVNKKKETRDDEIFKEKKKFEEKRSEEKIKLKDESIKEAKKSRDNFVRSSKFNLETSEAEQLRKKLSQDSIEKLDRFQTKFTGDSKKDGKLSQSAQHKINAKIMTLYNDEKDVAESSSLEFNPYHLTLKNYPETESVVGKDENWVERIPVEKIREDIGSGKKPFHVLLATCRHKFSHHPDLKEFYGTYPRGLIDNLVRPFQQFIVVLISIMKKLGLHDSVMKSMKSLTFQLKLPSTDH